MSQPNSNNSNAGSRQIQLRSECKIRIPEKMTKYATYINVFRDISPMHSKELVTPADLKQALDSIKLFEIAKVIGHEQTIKADLKAKLKKLESATSWPFPLVDITENGMGERLAATVREKPALILNGHHKFAAMKQSGYTLVPGLVHDYYNEIRIGAWYPVLTEPFTQEMADKLGGIKCAQVAGQLALQLKRAYFMAVNATGNYVFPVQSSETNEIMDMQSRLLDAFNPDTVFYSADYNFRLELGNGNTILMRRPYDSETVWEEALKGNLFPPKSTRHEFLRVKMDMPLEWLKMPLAEANARLQGLLGTVKENLDEIMAGSR